MGDIHDRLGFLFVFPPIAIESADSYGLSDKAYCTSTQVAIPFTFLLSTPSRAPTVSQIPRSGRDNRVDMEKKGNLVQWSLLGARLLFPSDAF